MGDFEGGWEKREWWTGRMGKDECMRMNPSSGFRQLPFLWEGMRNYSFRVGEQETETEWESDGMKERELGGGGPLKWMKPLEDGKTETEKSEKKFSKKECPKIPERTVRLC